MTSQKKSLGRVRYEAISSVIEDGAAVATFWNLRVIPFVILVSFSRMGPGKEYF